MAIRPLIDWRRHLDDGRRYLKTAVNGQARPAVFTPELTFQLTAMAVEKFLVGLWQYQGQMPGDHTLEGLADGLNQFCPMDEDLVRRIKELGQVDPMCALAPVCRKLPTQAEIRMMLETGLQVEKYALAGGRSEPRKWKV